MGTQLESFVKLRELTASEGFWEVIAYICLRDTFIHLSSDKFTKEDFHQNFDKEKLSQTEISTLIGLACQNRTTVKLLSEEEFQKLLLETDNLWKELHSELIKDSIQREAIFYSGNGVYQHQYRDLAKIRYQNDDVWIKDNKGFNLSEVVRVFTEIENITLENLNTINYVNSKDRSFLSFLSFTHDDLVDKTGFQIETIEAVLSAFSVVDVSEGMSSFNTIDDFNHRNAYPIIKINNKYVSFQSYSLWESLYESPFFWFNSDDKYKSLASKNRGAYTEDFTASRLKSVFGEESVFTNIDIFDGKNKAGEIDVLVIYGKYILVIQAKSKKLTIQARKGNVAALNADFQKAIQDAYDQAWSCCNLLLDGKYTLKTSWGEELSISTDIKKFFPLCVISDYYPALTFQVRQFLKYEMTDSIAYPYVMDVFLIDLITELLPNPLLILDFFLKRSQYKDSLISAHELVVFSTYLFHNLYFEGDPDLVMLDEDLSANLEIEMLRRREKMQNLPELPDSILKYFESNSPVGFILNDIAFAQDYGLLQLGFLLLSVDLVTIDNVNNLISHMCQQFKRDGKGHDGTIPIGDTGLTIHCNNNSDYEAYEILMQHCLLRKYSFKANSWQGICFSPISNRFRFSIGIETPWEYSKELEELLQPIQENEHRIEFNTGKETSFNRPYKKKKKIGRNDLCICGSLKKYKICCLKI